MNNLTLFTVTTIVADHIPTEQGLKYKAELSNENGE